MAEPIQFDPEEQSAKLHNMIWTERPIPYYIDEVNVKDERIKKLIEEAIGEFQKCTNLKLFKKIEKDEANDSDPKLFSK